MQRQHVDYILTSMLNAYDGASDLNITVGKPFQVESSGVLKPVPLDPPIEEITPYQAEIFALNLISGDRRAIKDLLVHGSCDISYEVEGKARFRVNIFSQRGSYSTVMRQLPTKIPTIEELNLPPAFNEMAKEKNGFVLVTGATGSGKSTSLAALLNEINEKHAIHVVTLEDPIEFVHPQKKATFNQRELGADFDSFASGLRAALRQAPKIILVGEMRDRETVEIALSAAETGHLVLSTLHTIDAGQAINRIVSMFEHEEERQVRLRLADTVRWIVCQRLLPKEGGGRVAAFDILRNNLTIQDLIIHGETEDKTFYDIMSKNRAVGMMTFDQCIAELFKKGLISEQTALTYATRKSFVRREVDTVKAERGEKVSTIEGLTIDTDYGKRN
ncbi:MAG: twitching motility protein [Deltaproteobacteria bacterium]|nr:MAG: twitching motility protein [Deltaproteobacteria bacterium]